jgi:exodeoxyribonuclease VII large subunit
VRSGEAVITTRATAERAARLELEFHDGRMALDGAPRGKPDTRKPPPDQGSLF